MTAETLFLLLLDRSIAAGWLILALLLLRPFLCRVSRSLCCAMWGLVAFRLLCPFSLESALSLLPSARPVTAADAGTAFSEQTLVKVSAAIWSTGVLLLALYMIGSYWRLRLLVQEAVKKEDGVWQCDRIDTPFILGVFRPRILLPLSMDAQDIPCVLAHERAHLARHDHWRKPVAFALLILFWFQPMLWIAYVLLGRDIEFACDARTVRALGGDDASKACYAKALLRGSVPRVAAAKLYCPLAFGGLQTKRRVQSVLKYRRPAVALLLAAALVCGVVAVCFLTDPKEGMDTSAGMSEADLVLEAPDDPAGEDTVDPQKKPSGGTASNLSGGKPAKGPYEDEEVRWEPTAETLAFIYCLSHFETHCLDEDCHHYVFEYENFGDEDGSVTLLVFYGYDSCNETGELEGRECEHFGAELITIPLPAGEKVAYAFEPGYWYNSMCYGIVGASYGDVSVEDPFMDMPVINNMTVEEYLKGCTHGELVVKNASAQNA